MPTATVNPCTISFRANPAEKERIEQEAAASGVTMAEYCRQILLAEKSPDQLKLIAAEMRAMRSILFQLLTAALNHQPLSDQIIQQIVTRADATKYNRAEDAISELIEAKQKGAA